MTTFPWNPTRPIVLFHAPSMRELAEAICAHSEAVCGHRIDLGDVTYERFGNGFTHPVIAQANKLAHKDVAYLMSFDEEADIYVQMSVARWIAKRGPHSLTLLLPYLQNATMDRSDTEDEVCMAETLAAQFVTIPPVRGPVPLWMMDIHALQVMNFFDSNHVTPWLDTAMNLFREYYEPETTAIAFPDDGAWKRYKNMFRAKDGSFPYDFVICGKVRDGDKRIVTVREGDPSRYRDVVIVDDLTHSGGTLIECKKALASAGAKRVSAAVAHADFDRDAGIVEKIEAAGFHRFHLTDSCPLVARAVRGRAPFEVSTIRDLAIQAIVRGVK